MVSGALGGDTLLLVSNAGSNLIWQILTIIGLRLPMRCFRVVLSLVGMVLPGVLVTRAHMTIAAVVLVHVTLGILMRAVV